MGKIAVLDKQTAELIAAGEVVDRPASVAKELIENAIDAGATAVTVEVQRGGILYLRVTDNGSGMLREDIPTAFLRHATSKIHDSGDLDSISTLGFRGEALAAIAAVSKVELTTRTADELAGACYRMEGGEEIGLEDAGCPQGTTIVVRDLFYNTPARMKFLKRDISEANAVSAVVDRQALSHPEVAFTFIRDGKTTLRTPGDGKLMSAVYQVCGREFAGSMLPVSAERGGIWVNGYVCKPTACRPNRNLQYFYINGRLVKSRTMMAALEQAYRNTAMVGKFPACVLHMNIPYQTVDVNVHPAKLEVRFSDEKRIFDAVYYGAKTAIAAGDTRPQMQLGADKGPETAWSNPKERIPGGRAGGRSTGRGGEKGAVKTYQQELLPNLPQSPPRWLAPERGDIIQMAEDPAGFLRGGAAPALDIEVGDDPLPTARRQPPAPTADRSDEPDQPVVPAPSADDALEAVEADAPAAPPAEEPAEPAVIEDAPQLPIRVIGEVFRTYILCEQGDELVLLDKHAAHERILYEELKDSAEPRQQMLLTPEPVRLPREEYAAIMENIPLLQRAGYDLDDFGGNSVIVRALPLSLSGQDVSSLISELAGGFLEHRRSALPQRLDWLYHSVACRAAVKAGDHSEPAELESLARRVLSGKDIMYCPHGRPVAIRLTRKELEKQFGRMQ